MPAMPNAAISFMMALGQTGYFFPVLKITEVVSGILLLTGMYVPLALVLLAPIIVQITLFHVFLAPDGLLMAIAIVILEIVLAMIYKEAWKGVLSHKTKL